MISPLIVFPIPRMSTELNREKRSQAAEPGLKWRTASCTLWTGPWECQKIRQSNKLNIFIIYSSVRVGVPQP